MWIVLGASKSYLPLRVGVFCPFPLHDVKLGIQGDYITRKEMTSLSSLFWRNRILLYLWQHLTLYFSFVTQPTRLWEAQLDGCNHPFPHADLLSPGCWTRQEQKHQLLWVRGEMRYNTTVSQGVATNNLGFRSCCITLPLWLLHGSGRELELNPWIHSCLTLRYHIAASGTEVAKWCVTGCLQHANIFCPGNFLNLKNELTALPKL